MSPEERLGADTRLTTLASVTEVVISGDLQVCFVAHYVLLVSWLMHRSRFSWGSYRIHRWPRCTSPSSVRKSSGALIHIVVIASPHHTHTFLLPPPSFSGDERRSTLAFSGLQRLEGYLRSQVGKAMQLRFVPELRFFRDEGAERGGRVLNLLSGLRDGESPALAASDIDIEDSDFFEEEEDNSDVELIQYSSEESDGDIIMVHSDGEVST
jgi:ribosome-binding factor A